MGKEEETTQVNTRISAFRNPTTSPDAIPLPSKFYELGRGLGKMRSVPAPCHHQPPLSPIWPGLRTHAWVLPSPTTIQRRLLGLGTALRIGHHPRRRGLAGEGGRPGGDRALPTPSSGGGGRNAAGDCTEPHDSWSSGAPAATSDLNGEGSGDHYPPTSIRFFELSQGRGVGWLRTPDRP